MFKFGLCYIFLSLSALTVSNASESWDGPPPPRYAVASTRDARALAEEIAEVHPDILTAVAMGNPEVRRRIMAIETYEFNIRDVLFYATMPSPIVIDAYQRFQEMRAACQRNCLFRRAMRSLQMLNRFTNRILPVIAVLHCIGIGAAVISYCLSLGRSSN